MLEQDTIQKKSLVGCLLKLDPQQGGMLRDDGNGFVFSYFDGGKSEMLVKKDTELKYLTPNIKYGILRVFKDGKDVSVEYGGKHKVDRFTPIVKDGFKEPDIEDKKDVALLHVLESYDPEEIQDHVNTINDYASLERLLQLEKAGNNLASQPRPDIVDMIFHRLKDVSGMTRPEKEEGTEEEVKLK